MNFVNQHQIAAEAGVSRSTVSAVLSNSAIQISPEVRQRVLKVASNLNYRPNRYAQVMRNGKTGLIALIDFGRLRQLSHRKIRVAAEKVIREQYEPLVLESLWLPRSDSDEGEALCRRVIDSRVEGAVLVHPGGRMFKQECLDQLLQAGIRVVVISGGDYLRGITCFNSDREWGYYTMAHHLLGLGYRRLALLTDDAPFPRRGIERAVAEHSGGAEARFCCPPEPPVSFHPAQDYLRGKNGMEEILAWEKHPEAVICGNDQWAQGALLACSEAGISVPRDIALTGFDDDIGSAFGAVSLTTMAQPIEQLAEGAVQCLLEAIREGRSPESRAVHFRGNLIVRRSCGAFLKKKEEVASKSE